MLVDCHTHLDPFPDNEVRLILDRAKAVDVGLVVTAGTTKLSSERASYLSKIFPEIYAGIGIHPMDITESINQETYTQLMDLAKSNGKVVAISEIGLDFLYGAPDRAIQYQAFREQIRLARECQLPIIFHSRESHPEVLRILREEKAYECGGVMHYFQGDIRTASQAIDLGFYISLARPLMRLPELQKVASDLPLSNIVLETDATPQPFKKNRDSWTEPRHVRDIALTLSQLRREPISEIEKTVTANILQIISVDFQSLQSLNNN